MSVDEFVTNCLLVLAIDDDTESLDLLKMMLSAYGIDVVTATLATEALAIIAQLLPDVLLINIAMPDMDGYTLLRQIRSFGTDRVRQIPAIALTAFATDNEHAAAIVAGFQIYLTKPFEFMELFIAIENLASGN